MGSVGSDSLFTFAQELAKVTEPMHLIIACGRYQAIQEKVKTIIFPKHISVTTLGFVEKISDLMAVSDLLITKAGPVSMSEAMYMHLPVLVDVTSDTLNWEKLNYMFIQNRRFGDTITTLAHLSDKINNLLANPTILAQMKNNLLSFDKKVGTAEVQNLIKSMI